MLSNELIDELLERGEFLGVHKPKVRDKMHKMFEARVKVGLGPQRTDIPEMAMVHVTVDTEKALEDLAYYVQEVTGKGLSKLLREYFRVVEDFLGPFEKSVHVVRGR